MLSKQIEDRISNIQGDIGIYYRDIKSGEYAVAGNKDVFIAAGISKLYVLIETFNQINNGKLNKDFKYKLKKKDKAPSIGALMHLNEGKEFTVEELYRLMIAISDNTAFNILVEILGIDNINNTMNNLGFYESKVNRTFFDYDAMKKGIENYTSVQETGEIFLRLYNSQLISKESSIEILEILKLQQRGYIIPYYFGSNTVIAHQIGEDEGIIHDAGIVYTRNPFILCMSGNDTDVRRAESAMRDIALLCYKNSIRYN